ncbi:MAG TPA: hypothetical protein VNB22_09200 [Pyrinomonadaceae bacterium]|nr:hypothetical protein [Pyrinomonadaceae bacterium]
MKRIILSICLLMILFIFQTLDASGQLIIMPYTIQGFLKDGNVPANGNYDISYNLYDTETSTTIVGGNNHLNVPVTGGVFSFTESGYAAFHTPGRTLWIEFGFKPAYSQQPYTILSPRQRMGAVPFSISSLISLDSMKLGGTDASQYILTTDARLSDARTPTAGSTNYIQNTTTQQTNANFNIAGNGTVGGTLSVSALNVTAGINADNINVNSAFGYKIGGVIAFSMSNGNTSAGNQAGLFNSGTGNSFYGQTAGRQSSTGSNNSFFGAGAGYLNDAGNENSFFGYLSGNNSQGSRNSFFGWRAGLGNGAGNSNTLLGYNSQAIGALTNASAIGSSSQVNQSNALVLGSINGVNGATADTFVGIGTTTPAAKFHVNGNVRVTNGAVYITNPNTVIITSPNGACWGITVNNSGALATFPVNPCP